MALVRKTGACGNAARRRLILLLDRSASKRFPVRPLLRQFGYDVCTAGTLDEALDCVRIVVPALIMVDAAGTEQDLAGLPGRLRQEPGCAAVPVVLLAALPAGRQPYRDFAAVLRKPFLTDDLYRTAQQATERTPRRNIRIATRLKAVQGDAEGVAGLATELSEQGLFFQTALARPARSRLPLWFWAGEREIRIEAEVLYRRSAAGDGTDREPGMGMAFVRIRPEDQRYLRAFILKRLRDGAQATKQ